MQICKTLTCSLSALGKKIHYYSHVNMDYKPSIKEIISLIPEGLSIYSGLWIKVLLGLIASPVFILIVNPIRRIIRKSGRKEKIE